MEEHMMYAPLRPHQLVWLYTGVHQTKGWNEMNKSEYDMSLTGFKRGECGWNEITETENS